MPTSTLPRELLTSLVDYAGLFPPAGLNMVEAARNYASYREVPERWMLGSFVVPVGRLHELAEAAPWPPSTPWSLSVLVTAADALAAAATLTDFKRAHHDAIHIAALEVKADAPDQIPRASGLFPGDWALYFEVPAHPDPAAWIEAIAWSGRFAKLRTGGITPDLIPAPAHVARFLRRCAEAQVGFKATAGLHHPFPADRPLTYEPDSPYGPMHGFLNVFYAAALLYAGKDVDVEAVLTAAPSEFSTEAGTVRWRDQALDADQLARARRDFAHSFGSCSFDEPVDDLKEEELL